ncbi:MAG: imidazolonepropionase [Candidatus Delongbacteria bacterium]|nr:imidazolonepropionase [Candidatus Delongbacteria bacterium]MBN2836474.1 imidazolonepropionase [Candidatus Delongbacteria bacterium]
MTKKIIRNIKKIYSPLDDFGIIEEYGRCTIFIDDDKIEKIINGDVEINALFLEDYEIIEGKNLVALPGFVDSHTHPVFANTREDEFEMRNQGMTYLEIAEKGGGIKNSVLKLRSMNEDHLYQLSRKRVSKFLEYGTTTIEGKSGYGLTVDDEIKMLRVIKKLNENLELDIVPTFLGAHDFPTEYSDNHRGYIELMLNEMLPKIKEENLAEFVDIFIEKNYYTLEEAEEYLSKAKKMGFELHVHSDQLTNNNGSVLAGKLGSKSAAHLDFISDEGIKSMIENNTIFNLLPGATFFIKVKNYAPARKIIEMGGKVAISSNFNPGSCYSISMPLMMSIAAIEMGMKSDELFWAATMGGASALNRENIIGKIKEGYQADIILTDINTLKDLPYMMGINPVKHVIKKGKLIF